MSDEQGLLADIADHPDDDGFRLIYADWLDDHAQPTVGDPLLSDDGLRLIYPAGTADPTVRKFSDARYARALLIRLQVTAATHPEGTAARTGADEAAALILGQFGSEWEEPLRRGFGAKNIRAIGWHRGFPEEVLLRRAGLFALPGLVAGGPHTIRRLDLSNHDVVDDDLAPVVSSLPNLLELRLRVTGVTDAGLAHIAHLTRLTALNLYGNEGVTEDGPSRLGPLTHLRSVDLGLCSEITDVGLENLVAAVPALRKLSVLGTRITDAGLVALDRLPALNSLNLSLNEGITDAGLEVVSSAVPNLNKLCLFQTGITDDGLSNLTRFRALSVLQLGLNGNITDAGVSSLASLVSLKELDASHTGITDAAVAALRNLGALRELNLAETAVSETGLRELASSSVLSDDLYVRSRPYTGTLGDFRQRDMHPPDATALQGPNDQTGRERGVRK